MRLERSAKREEKVKKHLELESSHAFRDRADTIQLEQTGLIGYLHPSRLQVPASCPYFRLEDLSLKRRIPSGKYTGTANAGTQMCLCAKVGPEEMNQSRPEATPEREVVSYDGEVTES